MFPPLLGHHQVNFQNIKRKYCSTTEILEDKTGGWISTHTQHLPTWEMTTHLWTLETNIYYNLITNLIQFTQTIKKKRWCLSIYSWPPLWSSGQSSWLQIQRPGFDFRRYHIFWEVVGLEQGPLSPVSITEELLERKSSDSGLENLDYDRRDSPRRLHDRPLPAKVGTNFADKRRSLNRMCRNVYKPVSQTTLVHPCKWNPVGRFSTEQYTISTRIAVEHVRLFCSTMDAVP
jgi:hypothetical protein